MRGLRVLAVAAVAALVVAGLVGAASFTDPVGDPIVFPEGADTTTFTVPDITAIDVTNTPSGLVTFRITLTNQTLSPLVAVAVFLDLDKNRTTGDDGDEAALGYVVDTLGPAFVFDRWDGSELTEVTTTSATGTFSAGVVTITVPRTELLDTRGFSFVVGAVGVTADGNAGALDFAPEAGEDGVVYDLQGLAPPRPPTLTAIGLGGTPLPPKAGKRFTVSTVVTRADTKAIVAEGRVTCTARVGGAKLRTTGRFASLRATCSMTIPKSARGKQLRGTLVVQSAGGTLRKPFTFRIS